MINFNNISVPIIYFNSQPVTAIYFNGVLVWSATP